MGPLVFFAPLVWSPLIVNPPPLWKPGLQKPECRVLSPPSFPPRFFVKKGEPPHASSLGEPRKSPLGKRGNGFPCQRAFGFSRGISPQYCRNVARFSPLGPFHVFWPKLMPQIRGAPTQLGKRPNKLRLHFPGGAKICETPSLCSPKRGIQPGGSIGSS